MEGFWPESLSSARQHGQARTLWVTVPDGRTGSRRWTCCALSSSLSQDGRHKVALEPDPMPHD